MTINVLIVGASIAGPTAAYWFAKAGAQVTVIERFPELRTNGQNVDIRTAGVNVMRKMPGLEEAVRAKSQQMVQGISIVDTNGRSFGTIKPSGNPDQQSLVSEYEIFRGDLSRILFDMTKDNENIRYVFGEHIVSMRQKEDEDGPVTVEFANGLPTAEYDLVVACDGATSRTRAMALGCGVRDHIETRNSWVAFFTIQEDLIGGSQIGQAYSAVGGRFLALGNDPSGATRVILMGVNLADDYAAASPFRDAAAAGDNALKRFLAQLYRGAGWRADEVMARVDEWEDFYATETVQVKTPQLHRGRAVLVGDAGYAPGPTGAGTTLAMAGAYVLAGEVAAHGGDLAAALRAYEEKMRPLIRDMQTIPPLVPTIFAPKTAWGIWLRNTIFAIVVWTRILDLVQRFFVNAFDNSEKYKVPDYEWAA